MTKARKAQRKRRQQSFITVLLLNIKYPANPKKIKVDKTIVFSQLKLVIFCFGQKQTREAFSLLSL